MFPVGYWPNSLPPGVIRLDAHTTWSSCVALQVITRKGNREPSLGDDTRGSSGSFVRFNSTRRSTVTPQWTDSTSSSAKPPPRTA
jgi:hypothetical protein